MTKKTEIYKIIYAHDEDVLQVYAKSVSESNMFGFIEVSDFVFGENSSVVIDPAEEEVKNEFKGVKSTFIPLSSIIRIDLVERRGVSKGPLSENLSNVTKFPVLHSNKK